MLPCLDALTALTAWKATATDHQNKPTLLVGGEREQSNNSTQRMATLYKSFLYTYTWIYKASSNSQHLPFKRGNPWRTLTLASCFQTEVCLPDVWHLACANIKTGSFPQQLPLAQNTSLWNTRSISVPALKL